MRVQAFIQSGVIATSFACSSHLQSSVSRRRHRRCASRISMSLLSVRSSTTSRTNAEMGPAAVTRAWRALHSFFRYVALHEPSMSALAQRVLAIPEKRYHRTQIQFLTRPEIDALMAAPDQNTWAGRRDRTLLLVGVQTGFRVSELIGLRCQHVALGTGAHLQCTGKGRKDRCTPLRRETAAALRAWLTERNGQSTDHVFPNARGHALSPDGVEYILAKHVATARQRCPSLEKKANYTSRASPHRGYGVASKRRRSLRDCPVARSRIDGDHPSISSRRFGAQREGPCQSRAVGYKDTPLPAR